MRHLADYLTVNISSPNTPGLRQLQERARDEREMAFRELPHLLQIRPPDEILQLLASFEGQWGRFADAERLGVADVGDLALARPDLLPAVTTDANVGV